jgi:hypothetical protein
VKGFLTALEWLTVPQVRLCVLLVRLLFFLRLPSHKGFGRQLTSHVAPVFCQPILGRDPVLDVEAAGLALLDKAELQQLLKRSECGIFRGKKGFSQVSAP